jgi:hypothetical protein
MKHEHLKAKIDELGSKYRKSKSIPEREQLSTDIRQLQVAMQDTLASGANTCPDGKDHRVIGMLKTPTHWNEQFQMQMPDVYEVGCLICPPVLVEREDGKVVERSDGKKIKVMVDDGTGTGTDKEIEVIGFRLKRYSHSARGATPKEAVDNWNSGKWVEDKQTDRVPSQTIFKP